MTLDQLRYFQAVCQYGSVSRAAQALSLSQPSVSGAIAKLEAEFGIMLFARQNKRLILTKEGTVLLKHADTLLSDVDNTEKRMKELSESKALNLGVPPMISSLILPILYRDFFLRFPQTKLNIIEDDRSGLMAMLEDNRINMALLPYETSLEDHLNFLTLTELENVCCMHQSHPLAHKASVSLKDLENEKLILFKNSFFQTERILERFRLSGIEPNVILYTTQVSTVQSIVSGHLAIGFMFRFLPNSMPNLVGIPLDPPMHTKVSLVWKKGEYLSDDMLRLIKFAKHYFQSQNKNHIG